MMLPGLRPLLVAVLLGLGATLLIDLWAVFLKRAFGVPSLSYCLLGRWILHMPSGTFRHPRIADAAPRRHECPAGWTAHYLIGATFAVLFVLVASARWLERPTLGPALLFGIITTLVPYFVLQPALGFGIASSRTPHPARARLKSLATHTVFGAGLYLWARLLGPALLRG